MIGLVAASVILTVSILEGYNDKDWLIDPITTAATVTSAGNKIEIGNGLVRRTFVTTPAFGTVDVTLNASIDFGGQQSLFRAVTNETIIAINGTEYLVGGLRQASTFRAYCNRTELQLLPPSAESYFKFVNFSTSNPVAPFPWTPGTRHSPKNINWPPKGAVLNVNFLPSSTKMPQMMITLHFQVIEGIPVVQKWMSATLLSGAAVSVTSTVVDQLSVMPRFGAYFTHGSLKPTTASNGASSTAVELPLLYSFTDQANLGTCQFVDDYWISSNPVPGCEQCRDEGAAEPLLTCNYSRGPGVIVTAGSTFTTFEVIHLISDSSELQRHVLSKQRVTETLAPHVLENPIYFHGTSVEGDDFKTAIDQMVEVGFEMYVFSFGTAFDIENTDPSYISKIKSQVAYANSKGIEVGGYDLICLARGGSVPKQYQAVGNEGDACFASGWYDDLHSKILNFINETGLSMLATDGPYGGETCASTEHEHHIGLEDSVYQQNRLQNQFYKEMRKLNIFVNQPDNYYFQGGSRGTMGYDEQQYSLPRWRDLSISRMGMYDDLYAHLPSQGWMFLPVGDYHAGADAASFAGHTTAYEWIMAQYLGAGVTAVCRGPSPYATPSDKAMLTKWIGFFNLHREVLIKPIVHVKRPSMQSWDGWLHVNPFATTNEIGLLMVFNPTSLPINEPLSLDLYYTNPGNSVKITLNDDPSTARIISVSKGYRVLIPLSMPPESIAYFVIERA
eukprot:TRINITY_DN4674_c0_g1_i1.p1 TRINITY_DN4674_c0_g1~~TRINITY_DN4674_c0_g1_i1.p1  ORF type:complete len:744 (+),score=114.83 TRINITY_DN4674_c0_g1_i1:45-2234(+)